MFESNASQHLSVCVIRHRLSDEMLLCVS